MSREPRVVHRDEQPYVAVRTSVTMEGLAGAVDRYFPELFGWVPGYETQDNVHAGVLPAGRYVTTSAIGPHDGLVSANAEPQEWGERHGIRWAMHDGRRWGARVERYLTDPRREPDPSRWQTELAYLASGD